MARDRESRLVYSTDQGARASRKAPRAVLPPPPAAGARLRLDRRASGRVVTVVTGLPGSADEVEDLARSLKSACGTGGTVKDGALELQGDHRGAVEKALAGRGLKSKRAGG